MQVKDGILYVNSKLQAFPTTARIGYKVWLHDYSKFQHLTDSLHLPVTGPWGRPATNYRIMNLVQTEVELLKKAAAIDSLSLYIIDNTETGYRMATPGIIRGWTTDNYGPFVVPQKGMCISLDKESLMHYKTILQDYEGLKTGDKPGKQYCFKQDYYFMMGDNRHNSTDSRVWGAVPEELITGKATRVLWSWGYRGFSWNRILKKIK